jgi:PHD/YefM family antitoxin component YafN of YafNO toxin-antitoxin module
LQKPQKGLKASFHSVEGMAETIVISKKEYEGMKETIEILQDPEMLKQILESEKNIKEGKIKKFGIVLE